MKGKLKLEEFNCWTVNDFHIEPEDWFEDGMEVEFEIQEVPKMDYRIIYNAKLIQK